MLRRLTSTSASWAPLPLRLAMGVAFVGHGAQKVLGTFNGPGWAKWIQMPAQYAPLPFMRPTAVWLGAAAIAELVAGILILLGLMTRIGALLLIPVMITAIFILWPAYFAPGGMELAVTFLAISLTLLITGGGQLSIDRMLARGGRR